ncbi:MAG TPA: hypothetical protein VG674_17440 [Amycolatopsis sp.]|nr:hypothetical protein [Amycolatopsis sp.]
MAEQHDHGQPDGTQPAPGGSPRSPGQQQHAQDETGASNLPARPQPSGEQPTAPPPGIDPAELAQFRQFQQFQDYLRFTQAQQGNQPAPVPDAPLVPVGSHQPQAPPSGWPPAPPNHPGALAPYEEPPRPRRPVPRWLKRLGGKVLGWVVVLLIIGIAATWAYHHFFPSDDGKSSAQVAAEGGGTYHTNQILTTASPYESVRRVYDGIAQDGPGQKSMADHVCGLFDQQTQQKFAEDLGYPDCRAAVDGLHRKLDPAPGSVNNYAESINRHDGWPPGDTVRVNSCDFTITGGPALGDFTVKQVEKGQWLIVGHSPGPAQCPPTTSTTAPS